jgi:hypothetical protein
MRRLSVWINSSLSWASRVSIMVSTSARVNFLAFLVGANTIASSAAMPPMPGSGAAWEGDWGGEVADMGAGSEWASHRSINSVADSRDSKSNIGPEPRETSASSSAAAPGALWAANEARRNFLDSCDSESRNMTRRGEQCVRASGTKPNEDAGDWWSYIRLNALRDIAE